MPIPRTAAALLLTMILAAPAIAQEASSSEFGRASGGDLALALKTPSSWSGSLGLSLSNQSGNRTGATFGGNLVPDRLWFFGTAERSAANRVGRDFALPQSPMPSPVTIPTSFLSLRYSGIVSSNSFFTATVGRSSTQPAPVN